MSLEELFSGSPNDYLIMASAVLLLLAVGFSMARLFYGPRLADRAVAFEVMTLVGIGAIAVVAARREQEVWFIVLMAWTVVSFLATVGFARYIERRGKDD